MEGYKAKMADVAERYNFRVLGVEKKQLILCRNIDTWNKTENGDMGPSLMLKLCPACLYDPLLQIRSYIRYKMKEEGEGLSVRRRNRRRKDMDRRKIQLQNLAQRALTARAKESGESREGWRREM